MSRATSGVGAVRSSHKDATNSSTATRSMTTYELDYHRSDRERDHRERSSELYAHRRHSYVHERYTNDTRSPRRERDSRRDHHHHPRPSTRPSRSKSRSRSRSKSRSRSRSRSPPIPRRSHSKPTNGPLTTTHSIDSSESPFLNELPIVGAVATKLKLMTYETMTGRLFLSKGVVQRFESVESKMNLNHQELLFRTVWHRPPPKPDSMSDEEYLRTIALSKLAESWGAYKLIDWIAIERSYLLPSVPFNVIIQFQPGSFKQYRPVALLLIDLNASQRQDASIFPRYQQNFISASRPEFLDICCTYFYQIWPHGGQIRGCLNFTASHKSHQLDQYQRFITQMVSEAGAPSQMTPAVEESKLNSIQPVGECASDRGFRLKSYDTMSGRAILSQGQDRMTEPSIRFEEMQNKMNMDHQELFSRIVWHQPPAPLNGLDMTNSANDEKYLREQVIPILLQSNARYHIHWVAIERQYLLPNTVFNVIVQCYSGVNSTYPAGSILGRLNLSASSDIQAASSFNQYQMRFGSTQDLQFHHLCNWYFEIVPTRGLALGCQTRSIKGRMCVKSHSISLFDQLIHQLLIKAGAPLQPLTSITRLEQPDIEIEAFEQSQGVLMIPEGCRSIEHTQYDPDFTTATRDSEAILHRLVWTNVQDRPPSLDRLITTDDYIRDLRSVLHQLTGDHKKHLNRKDIQWITRLTSQDLDHKGQPTNCILIQCQIDTSVAALLATWNRDFHGHPSHRPLQPFLEWWLNQRLPRYPDLYQQMCLLRWSHIRLGDGRLVHGCNGNHVPGESHDPRLMQEFIQRERESATTTTTPLASSTNQLMMATPNPSMTDHPDATIFLTHPPPMIVTPNELLSMTPLPYAASTPVPSSSQELNQWTFEQPNSFAPADNHHSNLYSTAAAHVSEWGPMAPSDTSYPSSISPFPMNHSNSLSHALDQMGHQAVTQTESTTMTQSSKYSTYSDHPPSSCWLAPRPSPTPIEARHPYYYSYPIGSILIDSNLNSTGIVINQPPTHPFTPDVVKAFNLHVPTGVLFEQRFRDEWIRTGQLSNESRREDAILCLDKLKALRLLTPDMDLLMVDRIMDLSLDPIRISSYCIFVQMHH